MKIRQQIVAYSSLTTIALVAIVFFLIYQIFGEYRREEYQDRLRDKIIITLKFLAEVEQLDHDMLQRIDKFSINNLYTENLLLFDAKKRLIYSGIDDTKIRFAQTMLRELSKKKKLIETREKEYDVVGAYVEYNGRPFYGITKAYDTFGFAKLQFLKYVLLVSFLVISVVILFVSNFLSRRIAGPLDKMSAELGTIDFTAQNARISVPGTRDEIYFLTNRFNELMENLQNAFAFQKHAVNHISHELKTPVSILVSNFDRIERENDPEKLKVLINNQKEDTKSLGDIINALLEISKTETGKFVLSQQVRMDELVFDVIQELGNISENFVFDVEIGEGITNEQGLTVPGNKRLLKSVITNLAVNSMNYSPDGTAAIRISSTVSGLQISFQNHGDTITEQERPFLFRHFFRGSNSKGKRGFGLGLVLIQKIMALHHSTVSYEVSDGMNVFTISLSNNSQTIVKQ
ncbi:MAG: HAMP domain-containing sensor histidine kinase [Bacteroidota bacterium]